MRGTQTACFKVKISVSNNFVDQKVDFKVETLVGYLRFRVKCLAGDFGQASTHMAKSCASNMFQ